ncbi:MAG: MBL fold metallo-hydrolase [Oceanococcus sp.]
MPVRTPCDGVVAPSPAYCGVDLRVASTVQNCLNDIGIAASAIKHCQLIGVQQSPAWHPQSQNVAIVRLELTGDAICDGPATPTSSWDTAAGWLQRWQSGELLLNPLSQGLLEHGDGFEWTCIDQEQAIHGITILPVRSHTLPPATHTNTLLVGPSDALWLVDPSPANKTEFENLRRRLSGKSLAGMFLTHHHGDHHQQCVALAQELELPIRCSHDTFQRIPKRFGKNYWQDVQVQCIEHGEILCTWKKHPVRAWSVPGHDAGQMALMPDNKNWVLVGDLIQGIGTVVIAKPEGHMADYFASLSWVIEQNPMAIIPSHGQVMGSSFRIEETLKHRKLREQQVLHLHQAGHSIEDMVSLIYADVDQRLWPLAKMNINCHLEKLGEESQL